MLVPQTDAFILSPLRISTGTLKAISQSVVYMLAGQAEAIDKQAKALGGPLGSEAAGLTVAREYVAAFRHLAHHSNTMLLPANAGDAASMVAQAMAVYKSFGSASSAPSR